MQVLSSTVGDALLHYNEEDTTETARFVKIFDRFFDMLNTRSLKEHIFQRKPDLSPYRTPDDTRLKVSIVCINLHVRTITYSELLSG